MCPCDIQSKLLEDNEIRFPELSLVAVEEYHVLWSDNLMDEMEGV